MSYLTFSPSSVCISNLANYAVIERDLFTNEHFVWCIVESQHGADGEARDRSLYCHDSEFIVVELPIDELMTSGFSSLQDLDILSFWYRGKNLNSETSC